MIANSSSSSQAPAIGVSPCELTSAVEAGGAHHPFEREGAIILFAGTRGRPRNKAMPEEISRRGA
jgi:hypothetical protein